MSDDVFHTGRPGRPERSDMFKLRVHDFWEENGIAETIVEFGLKERQIRRCLADARKIRGVHSAVRA